MRCEAAISAYEKVRHHRRTLLPLRVMWRHAIVWDTITYAEAISLCEKGQ